MLPTMHYRCPRKSTQTPAAARSIIGLYPEEGCSHAARAQVHRAVAAAELVPSRLRFIPSTP